MSSLSGVSPAVKISLGSQFLCTLATCLPPGIQQRTCAATCVKRLSSWCRMKVYLIGCVCQVTKVGFPGAISISSVFLSSCLSVCLSLYIYFFHFTTRLLHIYSMFEAIQISSHSHSLLLTFLLLCVNVCHSPGLSVPTSSC